MSIIRKFKVIGLGGIGSYLADFLCRYLNSGTDDIEVTVIDGDRYELRNAERQQFDRSDNKAKVTAETLSKKYPRIHIRYKAEYITPDNVISLIREDEWVFLCVDNHSTRKLVSDRCGELANVVLISGGNDLTDGNVIRYVRRNEQDISRSPTLLFPSIANPTDRNPGTLSDAERLGCETEAIASPQLLFTNLAAASCMCNVFYAEEQGNADFEQVFFDISTHCMRPKPERF